jgi:hypothetical protein
MEGPPEHPGYVGVHCGNRALERKAGNGSGRVSPYAGQTLQLLGTRGNQAAPVLHHFLGQPLQIRRPTVVPQSFPALPYPGRWRSGERLQCRVLRDKPPVKAGHSGHLGLLQHELGHHDVIWIPSPAPGQIPALSSEPTQQIAAESSVLSGEVGGAHPGKRSGLVSAR